MKPASVLSLTAALAACTADPPTELVVVVDTDLAVPAEAGAIEIEVLMPSERVETRSTVLTSRAVLPVTLGVVHREGPLGPVRLEARAMRAGSVVVRRSVSLTLVGGHSLLVWIVLSRECAGVDCPGGTCAAGACRDEALRPEEIVDYNGTIPTLSVDGGQRSDAGRLPDAGSAFDADAPPDAPGEDAGDHDSGGCPNTDEVCNARDDDCDMRIDEDFTLSTDSENCGSCGNSCDGPSVVTPMCVGGECMSTCLSGLADCTDAPGCDTPLGTLMNCLGCDDACMGATPTGTHWVCTPGGCAFECDANRGNCETTLPDCETDLRTDEGHCGECTRACTPPDRCMSAVCR